MKKARCRQSAYPDPNSRGASRAHEKCVKNIFLKKIAPCRRQGQFSEMRVWVLVRYLFKMWTSCVYAQNVARSSPFEAVDSAKRC